MPKRKNIDNPKIITNGSIPHWATLATIKIIIIINRTKLLIAEFFRNLFIS